MQWILGEVVAKREWTTALCSVFVKAEGVRFVAGQFTSLSFDPSGADFRLYSFVNAPYEPILEFYFNVIKEGSYSPRLAQLKPKEKVYLASQGAGRLIIDHVPQVPILWLFATGTGIGPYLSILKMDTPWQRFAHIVLVHSVHFFSQLTHSELMAQWSKRYPTQFHWFPIVTKERISGIAETRCTECLATGSLECALNLSLTQANSHVMLCGNPSMIKDMVGLLKKRGLYRHYAHRSGQISTEQYWK